MFAYLIYGILLALYAILIWVCLYYFLNIPIYVEGIKAHVPVSIIIAARNEEGKIEHCISSLLLQAYPKEFMEIIVVDDQSTDGTAESVARFAESGVRLISIAHEDTVYGKKAAIAKGISASKGELIMVTDADCVMQNKWVSTIAGFYQEKGSVFIASPVQLHAPNSFLELFQSLDFVSLQGITAAGVHVGILNMCNGANLAYTKSAFECVRGFEGIDKLPTGDDMLLMEKMSAAFPGKVHYCLSPEAIVKTSPALGLNEFIHQRIRWASKSTAYSSSFMKSTLLLVYLVNVGFVAMMILAMAAPDYLKLMFVFWMLKTVIEIPFMLCVTSFYKSKKLILWFPFMQPFHAVYTVVAGFFGWVGKYDWKKRKVKREE